MSSDQVAQGFIHWGLENLQGWRWYSVSGQPVPLLECEKILPHIQSELLLFQFMPIISSSHHASPWRTCLSLFDNHSVGMRGCCKVPLQPSLLQTEQAQVLQPVLKGQRLRLRIILMALCWMCSRLSVSFCIGGSQTVCSILDAAWWVQLKAGGSGEVIICHSHRLCYQYNPGCCLPSFLPRICMATIFLRQMWSQEVVSFPVFFLHQQTCSEGGYKFLSHLSSSGCPP